MRGPIAGSPAYVNDQLRCAWEFSVEARRTLSRRNHGGLLRIRSLAQLCLPAFILASACGPGEGDPSGNAGSTGTAGTSAAGAGGSSSAGSGGGAAGSSGQAGSGQAGTTGTAGAAAVAVGTAGSGPAGTGGTGGS